jgi:putative phosphoserine phosphatase/1-acylglycerol-3-phosphate O-acyltransferase
MAEDQTILAIFDFDGTLTTGHLWSGIAKHHRQHRVKRVALYSYLFSHLPLWLAAKIKLYNEEKNRVKWGEDLSILFGGFTREEGRKAFEWVTDNYFVPLLRPEMMELLHRHQKQGYKTMILSGMFGDFLEVVAQRIGVDYVVGTRLELVNGAYSGRIIKPLCFGENKAKFLIEFIHLKQLGIDLKRCWAYADSIYDTPVFRIVGNPVAAYPDEKLYRLALSEKWQIIGRDSAARP